ncbi:hypothetical protein L291_0372 [Acinetobacter guillouiae MSP4-18]|nr:hypothetical protein L291_0372 [Acinetobacter guillouiae MSP4-18]
MTLGRLNERIVDSKIYNFLFITFELMEASGMGSCFIF